MIRNFWRGIFYSLKDIHLGAGNLEHYHPSPALLALTRVYQYWIGATDVDGFRVDTVKHMDLGATRFFTSAIHEFTQRLGKENFYLIGEITGGRARAFETLETTGLNAALGVDEIPDKLEYLVKGFRDPAEYFNLFRNSMLVQKESHIWFRNRVVTAYDDHDQVRKGANEARFCHDESPGQNNRRVAFNALALEITTLGIPCIYYGSEQYFDGHGDNDRYLREAMFGGDFGPFASRGRHCFDETSLLYRQVAALLAVRRRHHSLRRGRQYLRPISGDGLHFGLPQKIGDEIRSVVPWSRLFNDQKMLLAINTDYHQARSAWVTVDNHLHAAGESLCCLFSTDEAQLGQRLLIEARNGKAVYLTVPAAGFVIFS
jgi:glycosidase